MTGATDDFIEYFPYTWYIRLLNTIGGWLYNWFGILLFRVSRDAMMKSAMKETKLNDFGDTFWQEPLNMFINVLNDPVSSAFTRFAFRMRIQHSLVHRLMLVDLFKRNKDLQTFPVKRPIFVMGLPRTGTSLLFALLAQDPAARPTYAWEQNEPFPPPEKETFFTDKRIADVQKRWDFITKNIVGERFKSIHNMDPSKPEEDMELLLKVFVDPLVMFVRPDAREFYDWFQNCDGRPFYEEERRYLQILGWKNPPQDHWVMKSPLNTIFAGTLMDVFPDANFVWTHRKVTEVVPSTCSLMRTLAALYRPSVDKREIGKATIGALKLGLERGIRERDSRPDANSRNIDVYYETLMNDPIDAVKQIYQKFGYTYTQEFEDRMKKWIVENPQRKFGGHKYTLEEYGLDTEKVGAAFKTYSTRFRVPI